MSGGPGVGISGCVQNYLAILWVLAIDSIFRTWYNETGKYCVDFGKADQPDFLWFYYHFQ